MVYNRVFVAYDHCMIRCPDLSCSFSSENIISVSRHAALKHGIPAIDTYVALICNGVRPTCACGCGEHTKFYTVNAGFVKYVRGHHVRVINNWGHNPIARENSRIARKASYVRGEWQAWQKGLTKETDERVAAAGRKESETLRADPEELQRRSDRMRKNRLDGTIRTLTGPEHSQWNGGTAALSAYCHGHSKLYAEWKYPKLVAAKFTCESCGSSHKLEVHHRVERMATIIKRFAVELGYDGTKATQHLKHDVANAVASYHVDADVPGIVLCATCHDLEHAVKHA